MAAGLIGVGGGEFRIPFLLAAYRDRVKTAVGVNLIVGLLTVLLAIQRRMQRGSFVQHDWVLATILVVFSTIGSIVGARYAHRIRSERLRNAIIAYLLGVGIWMVYEAASQTEHVLFHPAALSSWVIGGGIAIVVGYLSPIFGVAGGEMRIPALVYLLAIPIQEAGTFSLIASVPTVAAGAITYRQLGHLPNSDLPLPLILGGGSLAGVLIGAALIPMAPAHLLKGILGIVLILASVGLTLGTHSLIAEP